MPVTPEPGPGPEPGPHPVPPEPEPGPGPTPSPEPVRAGPRRYFGVAAAEPSRFALDAKQVLDEVIYHLIASGADVRVRIEVEATGDGFDERTVRTVSENATVLRFEQSGFEDQIG